MHLLFSFEYTKWYSTSCQRTFHNWSFLSPSEAVCVFVHFPHTLFLLHFTSTYTSLSSVDCPLLSASCSFSQSAVCASRPTGWPPAPFAMRSYLASTRQSVSSPPLNKSESRGETGCIIHELQAGRQHSTWHPFCSDEPGRVLLILLKHA